MRGTATKSMSDIVEERQQSRCPPAAAPLRAAARRPAGFVARSSHTAPGIARRSRLASGPGGQKSVHIISSQTLRRRSRALAGLRPAVHSYWLSSVPSSVRLHCPLGPESDLCAPLQECICILVSPPGPRQPLMKPSSTSRSLHVFLIHLDFFLSKCSVQKKCLTNLETTCEPAASINTIVSG